MNRLGVYDVDAAFDKMSLQTADEFGLDAILERLVRAADVEGVRRLIEVSTPEGYRVPAACLRAAQQTAYVFDDAGKEPGVLARSACYSDPMVVDHRRRAFDVLLSLVVAADEETVCMRGLTIRHLASDSLAWKGIISWGLTALHQLAWNGDVSALARVLALPWITEKIVNISASAYEETDCLSHGPVTLTGETPLHFACMAGRSAVVRLLLSDGRCSCDSFVVGCSGRLRNTPIAYACYGLRYAQDQTQRSCLVDCVRALISKDPRLADCSYSWTSDDRLVVRHALFLASTYACLEMMYVLLLAIRNFGPTTLLASWTDGGQMHGLDGLLENVNQAMNETDKNQSLRPSVKRLTHGGAWPCFEWVLTVVNSGGSVRAWRAEQARELLFLKRLVVRHRDRKRPRTELTMTHRLFLLRDDHLFVRILGYCWFVDTERRMRHGAADAWTLLAERRGA